MSYSSLSENPADRAKALLIHYFQLALDRFDSDNEVEIANAVQYIIDAAVEQQPDHQIAKLAAEVRSLNNWIQSQNQLLDRAHTALVKTLEYLPEELVDEVDNLADEIAAE